MKYKNITPAVFLDRPNRFIAHVETADGVETVHVKNTGRCRELLIKGSEVYLTAPGTPGRKTVYDLVAVRKGNGLLVNMDSQAPNVVVREWLDTLGFDRIVPEHSYGDSRMDFYMEYGSRRFLMEVKGCTLEIDGTGYFPDAPTERGVRHLMELVRAVGEGYTAVLTFVIQMDGIREVRPNVSMHPEFGEALEKALKAGVQVVFLECHVEPDSLTFKHVAREITAGWFK
ncbi:MAG: DNA/RNA nuclease SfsA [Ruminobacter sp.]|uniref:DNA/RNA nuclease SfsA n=1 Tax=Ruminobacter sp. TaxID=2774296 RepID=UPI00257DFB0F|nr:DNA/RNA nuclease SfsA [Ruminobacter sp.]MBQ3774573.1 DNA/RNA nuclease SfsA [Ruminobacter sp.]